MWYVLQMLVVFAVVTSNAYLHWTPNGYLAGFIGVGAAMLVTFLLSLAIDFVRKLHFALKRH